MNRALVAGGAQHGRPSCPRDAPQPVGGDCFSGLGVTGLWGVGALSFTGFARVFPGGLLPPLTLPPPQPCVSTIQGSGDMPLVSTWGGTQAPFVP